jgi:hypothetical protein
MTAVENGGVEAKVANLFAAKLSSHRSEAMLPPHPHATGGSFRSPHKGRDEFHLTRVQLVSSQLQPRPYFTR